MANTKISGLTALAEAPNDSDLLTVVDVSDTTMAASGTNKKITAANLKSGLALTGHDHNDTYVALTGNQSISDVKTFTSIPLIPTTTPTLDAQATSKAYVDGAITAAGGYTDEMAQDAIGGILTDSNSIDFTYDDGAGTITAIVKANVYKAVGADETANVTGATTLAAGKVQIALGAEVTAGTSDTLAISPKALSDAGIVAVTVPVKASGSEVDTGTNDTKFTTAKAISDSHNVPSVVPGTAGNLMKSDGTDWTSAANTNLPLAGGTISGNILQGENTSLQLDTLLSEDEKYCGITEVGTMGFAATVGDLVYLAVADTKWELAKADAAATSGPVKLGIVCATTAENSTCEVLLWGKFRSAAFPAAFTVGAPVYVSAANAGDVVVAAPTGTTNFVVRIVGYGNTAEDLFFCPSNDFVELA